MNRPTIPAGEAFSSGNFFLADGSFDQLVSEGLGWRHVGCARGHSDAQFGVLGSGLSPKAGAILLPKVTDGVPTISARLSLSLM